MPVCRRCSAPYGEKDGAHDLCQACQLAEILKPERGSNGESFGPYEIVCPIGEGGLAVVYLAEQIQPMHREVALKVMKQGDAAVALGRMELQVMARLEHPHIARLIDAGTSSAGRPFLAMEFVDGLPITEYCDVHALTVRQRLSLFAEVCRALQYAHGKGILHRDIKPSNILVAVTDGKAVPKIIDFGIAKNLDRRVPGAARTQVAQFVGTPEYMSPEQADVSNGSLRPTADVYSLGMVLYELLCGALPFNRERLAESSLGDVLRIIRDTEAPSPRTRLRQLGPAAESIARRRGTSLKLLQHELSGDLACILQLALAKDPGERYSSAAQLSDEIERYLANQPVRAHGRSQIYRWRKLMQRRRGLLLAVTGSALFAFACFLAIRFLAPPPKLWNIVPFSSAPGYEQYAAMSPNGREVAFAWDGDAGPRQIYVQSITSSSPRQLLKDTKEDVRPAWSPDGKRIAYVRLTERGRHDVYIASSDGSKAHNLTSLISYEASLCNEPHVDWSPDGSELVSVEQGNARSPCRVVAVNAVSGTKRFLTQPANGSMDVEPAFSPDGERIAFLRQNSPDVVDVFVIRRNGSGPPQRITFEQSQIRGFSWTSDGKGLVCSTRHAASFLNLWRFP